MIKSRIMSEQVCAPAAAPACENGAHVLMAGNKTARTTYVSSPAARPHCSRSPARRCSTYPSQRTVGRRRRIEIRIFCTTCCFLAGAAGRVVVRLASAPAPAPAARPPGAPATCRRT